MENIIKEASRLLEENREKGIGWESKYLKYADDIIGKGAFNRGELFYVPRPLYVYSKVSNAAKKEWRYDLRYEGQIIAEVVIDSNKKVSLSISEDVCRRNKNSFNVDTPADVYDWNDPVATKFRSLFINSVGRNLSRSSERRIESRILAAMDAGSQYISNITPVKLFNAYFQMPTPLSASKISGGEHCIKQTEPSGGIDILARTRHQGEQRSRLCIIELKDENKASESQPMVMEQALAYATFITYLLRSSAGQKWWNILRENDSIDTDIKDVPDELKIDVVTLMPTDNNLTNELTGSYLLKDLNTTLDCHTLYYDGNLTFSGSLIDVLKK